MKQIYLNNSITDNNRLLSVVSAFSKSNYSGIKMFFPVKSTLMIFVLMIGLASCEEDKSENHYNFFEVGSELRIPLTNGYIIDYGKTDSDMGAVYHMHVDLLDDGVSFNPSSREFSGAGNRLNVELNSSEDGQLASGTYYFEIGETLNIFTFHTGFIEENYDYGALTGHHHDITGGTMIVIYDGTTYDITFDCSLSTGSRFVGSFKGSLIYNDAVNL